MRFIYRNNGLLTILISLLFLVNCRKESASSEAEQSSKDVIASAQKPPDIQKLPRAYKIIHLFVALCDNEHQGIVPVPARIGNGQDPKTNLYWGAQYGVKTFFKKSPHWVEITSFSKPSSGEILDRCVFRSKTKNPLVYVVADAYDGACMKTTILDFLSACAGLKITEVTASRPEIILQAGGYSDMVCFIGHNGLMDTEISEFPENRGWPNPECTVILACSSHSYFIDPLRKANCKPLITTKDLVAPEAYTIDAIIRSWANGDNPAATVKKAGQAYAKYQNINAKAGERLFITGWGD